MNAIASERKRLGMSQGDLAKELGVDRSTVVRWEANTGRMSGDSLRTLASMFGCSVDYLLGRTDDRLPASR